MADDKKNDKYKKEADSQNNEKKKEADDKNNKKQKTAKPSTSQRKLQKRAMVIDDSKDDDEDSTNEMLLVCEESCDNNWSTFRAKVLDNMEEENQAFKLPKLQPIIKQVDSFVIISYNESFYSGIIVNCDEEGATVSAMEKTTGSGRNPKMNFLPLGRYCWGYYAS